MRNMLLTLNILFVLLAQAQLVDIVEFADGFDTPVDIKHANDSRLFIVEKHGTIKILNEDGNVNTQNFLDIDDRVRSRSNEQGLLGLAFHPEYSLENGGYFFVNYTNNDGDTTISKFHVDSNLEVADPTSEVILLEIEQPYSNHNAGNLVFGKDGYLYVGTGDGGSGGDPGNRAQNGKSLLGKMLRIDVDKGSPYTIPPDNPFIQNNDILDEIWALGLRNPWKYSFDHVTGDLWIADVGQNEIEEINRISNNKQGSNFGWRCFEGTSSYKNDDCKTSSLGMEFPIAEYQQTSGRCSITGGYVYRGKRMTSLVGKYIFADYCTSELGIINDANEISFQETNVEGISTFGEDIYGELYVAGLFDGKIYKIISHKN